MLLSSIAVIATTIGTFFTALGYILIKKSHWAARKRGVHNVFTWEFFSGIIVCGASALLSVGR